MRSAKGSPLSPESDGAMLSLAQYCWSSAALDVFPIRRGWWKGAIFTGVIFYLRYVGMRFSQPFQMGALWPLTHSLEFTAHLNFGEIQIAAFSLGLKQILEYD